MSEVDVFARKWGDSLAVIIPNDIVKKEKISANEKLHIIIKKEADFSDLFGKFKTKKSAQQLKDESRKAWE